MGNDLRDGERRLICWNCKSIYVFPFHKECPSCNSKDVVHGTDATDLRKASIIDGGVI